MQIGPRNGIWVQHTVGYIVLMVNGSLPDCTINHEVSHVNTLRREFPCHALCQAKPRKANLPIAKGAD